MSQSVTRTGRLVGLTLAVSVVAALSLASPVGARTSVRGPSAVAARNCGSFNQRRPGITYHWSRIKAHAVSCAAARSILRGWFGDEGRWAGQYPSDGTRIRGWLCKTGPAVPTGTPATCRRPGRVIKAYWI